MRASTGFNSEIWGDVDQFMQAFRRPVYSSVIFRLRTPAHLKPLKHRIEGDPRLTLEAKRETTYYEDQSEAMAKFLRILGTVPHHRVLLRRHRGGHDHHVFGGGQPDRGNRDPARPGISARASILSAFLLESLVSGFVGGFAGLFFASFLQFFTVSTTNFQTFSELAFSFALTLTSSFRPSFFSLIMGFAGGILPAFRAPRMNIVEALREA